MTFSQSRMTSSKLNNAICVRLRFNNALQKLESILRAPL